MKRFDGELIQAGTIIVRQRGTKIAPGTNVGVGRDHTLYALTTGYVKFEHHAKQGDKKRVSIYDTHPNIPQSLPAETTVEVPTVA